MRWLAALAFLPLPVFAEGEAAGAFDYYILSLSWSPTFCALTGDARGEDQCDPRHDHSFTLHGLWPQYEFGWPSYCRTSARDPSRADTRAMADIMGSAGLAWHEWKKHGRCTGLSADDYFAASRLAYEKVTIPDVLAQLDRDVKLPASVVEEAFLEANPGLDRNMITITCEAGRIDEARICLTRDLEFRTCGEDAIRDCRMRDALMEKVR
ncbi:ribonuclease T2 [Defluviimonas sp. WL0050]|uniref:Ribonuclease T2 n=1 Tax=Albidovulum litorale TaxID=2984134 RepID=A0ABT2ZKG7_9RHOB|nr:ribonuclease T2 [Defluviimonas sp. WL0050]MCV2871626.1 ribonuclease T2 [Defluviimonas sp. WL0050]